MFQHIQMMKTYRDRFDQLWEEHTGHSPERGANSIEMAIIAVALIALGVGLVVLLNQAFSNRSQGLS